VNHRTNGHFFCAAGKGDSRGPAVGVLLGGISPDGFGFGARISVTGVPRGGMCSVNASNKSDASLEVLSIGRSSMAPGKFETQIKSPSPSA